MRLVSLALTALLVAAPAVAETLAFARGNDGALWLRGATWQSLGGRIASAPDVTTWSSGRVDVFARGMDDRLWQISRIDGTWSAWTDLGGTLRGGPGAVAWGPNRIDVAAVGADHALWHRAWDGSRWTEWTSLGGRFADGSSPDLASRGANRLDIFARGEDGALWQLSFDGASWGEWTRLGGSLTSDPAAVAWGPDRIDVFARGSDGAAWQLAWHGSGWSDWIAHGGRFNGGLDVASSGPNQLTVAGRGTDDAVWQRVWDGSSWSDWASLGGTVTSDPAVIATAGSAARGRFRVTLTGFTANRETWDDALERDGKRDEVFLVHEARVLDAATGAAASSGAVRGAVMGDINRDDWRTTRVAAGSASADGGIRTGDDVPTEAVLWEGELAAGGSSVVIVPTIWEWDGDPDVLDRILGFLGAPIVLAGEAAGIALTASPESVPEASRALLGHVFAKLTGRGEIGSSVRVSKNVFGDPKDRPIGMKDAGAFYVFEPQALQLGYDTAALLSRTDFGRGAGVVTVQYRDAEELKGDYTLRIRVERISR